jgi:hypothetical protein
VAAREDQSQPVVRDPAHVLLARAERAQRLERLERLRLLAEVAVPADPVDRAVARRRRDPRPRVAGDASLGPRDERLGERLLYRVLGELEVVDGADQGRDRPPPFLAEQAVDDLACFDAYDGSSGNSWIGRTSTVPP